jgi:hypothetical protein
MKKFALVLFAGAALAAAAFGQENSDKNAPPAEQKQAQAAGEQCCNKDCCRHMRAKKEKASKKGKSATMACCK